MKPHIYLLRGKWTCARTSGQWQISPYGKGATPVDAYLDWALRMSDLLDSMFEQISVVETNN